MRQYLDTKYFISERGDVLNSKTGRLIKHQNNGNGYKKITLTHLGVQVQLYVHRLVADIYIPKVKDKNQVNHIDGDKSNNYFKNLEWVSNSENQMHAHKIGLKKSGDKLWNGKFSCQDLQKIKNLGLSGMKRCLIAREMNCSKSTISDILNNKRYLYFALTSEELTLKK